MTKKQYLDLTGLTTYDEQIKAYIDAADSSKANATDLTSHINNKSNPHGVTAAQTGALPTAGGTMTGILYTTASTPLFISKNGKVGMRAATDTKSNVGQINISNAWYSNGNQWGNQMSAYNGEVDAYNEFRVSHNGLEYNCQDGETYQVLHEGNIDEYAAPVEHSHTASEVGADAAGSASSALASAKSYADNAATTAANKVKNDLLNGAGAAYDTLKELGDLIDDNKDAIDVLEDVAAGKADAEHGHAIADVSGLQSVLDGKAASSHGTHVIWATNAPKMDGTAAVGSVARVAREDHVHPTDTSRASQADLDALESVVAGKADSGHTHSAATTSAAGFMTADMVTKLNGIATGANNTTVDTAMSSSSTNPVQNKIVYAELAKKATTTALDGVSSVANEAKSASASNTMAISSNTSAISALTGRVVTLEGQDTCEPIPTASITALFSA